MKYLLCVATSLLIISCGDSGKNQPVQADTTAPEDTAPPPGPNLQPPPDGQGFQMTFDYEVPAFTEAWICDVLPMPNSEIAAVNAVEVQQTPGTHHLTLSTLGLAPREGLTHGRFDCKDLYGDSSLMEDQIMFYGNQGDAESFMQLPEGVAATIPPGLNMIYEMHYVNATPEPVLLFSRINAWTIPMEDVTSGIWGGSVRDEYIEIPPNTEHTEWSRSVMNEDVEILFVASHTHGLGQKFTVAQFDGQTAGEVFYSNTDWHTPQIVQYDPPMVVPKGSGFEWTCTWKNPNDQVVNYGLNASDEMCNLAIVHTPFSTTAKCEVVETSDGVLWKQ